MKSWRLCIVIAALGLAAAGQGIVGVWSGTAGTGDHAVPFRLEIRSSGGTQVRGTFLNGAERSASSSGSFVDGQLVLRFDYYANQLQATLRDGTLSGTFGGHAHPVAITATRSVQRPAPAAAAGTPDIGGDWEIQVKSKKNEAAWKLHVRQTGGQAVAVILRVDGDTGNLYGGYRDGGFELSHFTADGGARLGLRPGADGTLLVDMHSKLGVLTARRPQAARRDDLAAPDDPLRHTHWKDANAPLAFRFRDLNGQVVANTDARFRGKVMMVAIGGSWCPNCHDEAPFLESLYRRYHRRGLDVVDLSFEEKAQLQDPSRLRAFVKRYGITYPVLLAGEPSQLDATLPEAQNLDCWPTVFFVGRDGRVRSIHAGYAGPASGADHAALVRETKQLLETLLARP